MIRSASPGPTEASGALPGGQGADDPQAGRTVGAGAGDVGRPHRVAVHRRVGERRHVVRRGHRLGQHQAEGLVEVDRRAGLAAAGGDDLGLGFGEGDHWPAEPLLEVGAERRAEVVAFEGQLDGGPQVVELVADVEAAVAEGVAVDRLGGEQEP